MALQVLAGASAALAQPATTAGSPKADPSGGGFQLARPPGAKMPTATPTAQFDTPAVPDPVLSLPGNVEGLLDLTYLERQGYRPLTLDLYRKRASAKRLPVVIYVHGGSFLGGDSRMKGSANQNGMNGFAAMLAARGYAVANVNYRLSSEAKLPALVLDIKASIRWLRANADKYNLDSDRFAVFGDSAGGGIAALLGTTCGAPQFQEKLPPRMGGSLDLSPYSDCVKAAIDWYGVIDMAQLDAMAAATTEVKANLIHSSPNSSQSMALGCAIGTTCTDAQVQMYNPINYLNTGAGKTAFLIMHGTHDDAVSYHQSELFYNALKAKGISAELKLVPGVGHYFTGATKDQIKSIDHDMMDFLGRTIGDQSH
jgi:acetyl esterase/lipase